MKKNLTDFSLKSLLYNKKFTIPFSILIAFVLWLGIVISQKSTMERTFNDMTVNINLESTFASENNMSIVGDISEQKFTVTVRGPSYLVSGLTSNDFNLYASAATVDAPGEYNLEVAATRNSAKAEYEILSISPLTVTVNFDYIETKGFTITPQAVGASASQGLIAENGVVSGTESDTVTIEGPRTVINKIDAVVAKATVNKKLSASETFDADIILLDENGKIISQENLKLSATKVKVTVPISKKKTVPVNVEFGNLPSNFNKSSISATIDHPTVTVIGTPDTIDKTTHISLSPIDITTLSTSSLGTFDLSAKLPEGVRLLDNIDHFTVSINLNGYIERTVNVDSVKYIGLAPGLKASGSTSIKNVRICGPRAIINKIDTSKIYAEIDLSNKSSGEHTVTAVIKFKDYNNIWSVGTYTTVVTIK